LSDGLFGCDLAARIERRANGEAARRLRQQRANLARNPIDEILAACFLRTGEDLRGIHTRACNFLFAEAARIDQTVEHLVRAHARALEVVRG
jgi:hypothetical protein